MSTPTFKAGLEDVVAGTSDLCFIDGREGRLVYVGYDIKTLVEGGATFEEVVYLLFHKRLPAQADLLAFDKQLRASRAVPDEVMAIMQRLPKNTHPMAALRTGISALGNFDPEAETQSREANLDKAIRLTAQSATLVAAWERIRNGQEPLAPRVELNHAANFLYMLFGTDPDPYYVKVFDVALILHADHELNASTFAGRVTIATLTDMYSAAVAALGTLKGPLHGGANEQVMKMLLEIGEVENAEPYVKDALARKQKIMGFGHRVYRTKDPRAYILEAMSEELGRRTGETKWLEMSRIIERVVNEQKGLWPNVDFFSASAYYVMGISTDLYTPIFAISRMSGWTAHILEQLDNNRIIRPRAEYTGPDPDQTVYKPLDRR